MNDFIQGEFFSHIDIAQNTLKSLVNDISKASKIMIDSLKNGNKIMVCGNGGSAADSQHFAAELSGRYMADRDAISCIALTTDTSALTAIGNDFGFEFIFSRQIEALAKSGDILLAISTSGTSPNIIRAIDVARSRNCKIIGLSGKDGGNMNDVADLNIVVPSSSTPRIQEMHLIIEHILCNIIEREFI
ncbi:D-sedoheptulose 7-phosphate isomerase [Helicobacter sp. MIT 14-3879]|uniref:D-sedoheptulose 7-phosphate isomerase n=1 Tax=Helicobacter sp. MIT 14-3879 TaxID=2040649 RepID=UPI000E1F9862|nr:D-sedoheptulose 7-phosphate isomerase [Helicobacter sp. MIT 14-3879]RDU63956.1 D-sedoheptulose 7-phosphate isomerase [Helicobacter sp. MIT 14-3879]